MQRRTMMAAGLGAVLGVIAALAVMALLAPRVLEQGVASVFDVTGSGRAVFVVSAGATWLWTAVTGAAGGAILGAIASVIGREADPESRHLGLTSIAIMGAVIGAIVSVAAARSVLGIGASIELGVLTVSVFRALIAAVVAGAVTGAVVGLSAERLSRADALGFGGVAWPDSPGALARDVMAAMGMPLVLALGAMGFVVLLAQLILSLPHIPALVVFGGAAALVLAVGALLAAMPSRTEDRAAR